MNRRGFFGAVFGAPLAAAVTRTQPAGRLAFMDVSGRITVTTSAACAGTMRMEMLGLHGWIPIEPPTGPFFGVDRTAPFRNHHERTEP